MSEENAKGLDLAVAAASAGVADFNEKNVDKEELVTHSGIADWMKSWSVVWTCEKWSEDACDFARRHLGLASDAEVSSAILRTLMIPDLGVEEKYGNLLLNAGITRLLNLLIGTGATQAYDSTHTRVGVGDSNTAAVATQTDLQATAGNSDHRAWSLVTSADVVSNQTVTCTSDFTTTIGNFAWAEWGIDQGTATTVYSAGAGSNVAVVAAMLNRKVESLGTKTTGTWTLAGAITIS